MDKKGEKPIYFYVANLGSEIQRILVWKEKGDSLAMHNAYKRAVHIIEKVKSFGNKSANAEMEILLDSLDKLISVDRGAPFNKDQISAFFNPFAVKVVNEFRSLS